MTEPQVWTLIGVFAAGLFGMMTLMSTMFIRVIRAEIGGLRGELTGELNGLRAEMNARFEAMDTKFEAKFGALDRDIQALMRHTFPDRP